MHLSRIDPHVHRVVLTDVCIRPDLNRYPTLSTKNDVDELLGAD